VAAQGWQLVYPAHHLLPFSTVGLNAWAEHAMGNQVGYFVGYGLPQEVIGVVLIQLRVEAQLVFLKVGDTGFLAAQFQGNFRTREYPLEKGFSHQVTVFNTIMDLFWHRLLRLNLLIMPKQTSSGSLKTTKPPWKAASGITVAWIQLV